MVCRCASTYTHTFTAHQQKQMVECILSGKSAASDFLSLVVCMCDSVIFIFLNVLPLSWTSQHHHNHHHHCRRRRLCRRRNHNQLRFCRIPNATASEQRGQTNTAHWHRWWHSITVWLWMSLVDRRRLHLIITYISVNCVTCAQPRLVRATHSVHEKEKHKLGNRNDRADWVHGLIIEMAYFIWRLSSHTQKKIECQLDFGTVVCVCTIIHAIHMLACEWRRIVLWNFSWIHLARPTEPASKRRRQRQTEPKFIGLLGPLCMRWDLRCLRPNSVVAISVSNGFAANTKKM